MYKLSPFKSYYDEEYLLLLNLLKVCSPADKNETSFPLSPELLVFGFDFVVMQCHKETVWVQIRNHFLLLVWLNGYALVNLCWNFMPQIIHKTYNSFVIMFHVVS